MMLKERLLIQARNPLHLLCVPCDVLQSRYKLLYPTVRTHTMHKNESLSGQDNARRHNKDEMFKQVIDALYLGRPLRFGKRCRPELGGFPHGSISCALIKVSNSDHVG
jgi:hypothetical protein